jgi:hypothetical protein
MAFGRVYPDMSQNPAKRLTRFLFFSSLVLQRRYCDLSRKYLLPAAGFTLTVLVVPLSVGVVTTLLQFGVAMLLVFCCNVKPVEGEGQEMATVFGAARSIFNNGTTTYLTVAKSEMEPLL